MQVYSCIHDKSTSKIKYLRFICFSPSILRQRNYETYISLYFYIFANSIHTFKYTIHTFNICFFPQFRCYNMKKIILSLTDRCAAAELSTTLICNMEIKHSYYNNAQNNCLKKSSSHASIFIFAK